MEFLSALERKESREHRDGQIGAAAFLNVMAAIDPEKAMDMARDLMGIKPPVVKEEREMANIEWIKPSNADEYKEALSKVLADMEQATQGLEEL